MNLIHRKGSWKYARVSTMRKLSRMIFLMLNERSGSTNIWKDIDNSEKSAALLFDITNIKF